MFIFRFLCCSGEYRFGLTDDSWYGLSVESSPCLSRGLLCYLVATGVISLLIVYPMASDVYLLVSDAVYFVTSDVYLLVSDVVHLVTSDICSVVRDDYMVISDVYVMAP